ncbi:hypothetical protein IU436_27345 [Nocardia farcinica]|uniref:hypothetical protein n=1 Tax=Nocardia farcinica TaxID=37329 RepID=UPI001895530C|nr:hypothetical protein [Nocardia farcinica]MBF6422356.1 hypothetical protein [Nocardia farcinica]MBF6434057.1 hypothetical protein [Nocardia farcinica]MBF6505113.1 hypothetical protein [Nocardia farcinica]
MIETDDLLYRVDRHFLGPTGHTLPVRLRYTAIGVGTAVFTTALFVQLAMLHMPFGLTPIVFAFLATTIVTTRVTRYVNADRPLRSVLRAAWNDVNSPRPPKPHQTVTVVLPERARPAPSVSSLRDERAAQ